MNEPHSPPELVAQTTESADNFGCLRVISIVFIVFVIITILILGIADLTSAYLQRAGVQVNATVINKTTYESCSQDDCSAVYMIRYTFRTLQEQLIQGEEVVDHHQYHQLQLGADWPIVYLHPDPTAYESRYRAVKRVAETWQLLYFFLITYLFLFMLIGLNWLRERQFQRKSILIQGVMTQRWKKFDEEYNYNYFIAYAFPDGAETQASVSLSQYQQVKVGSTIMVRYLPSNPRRSRLEL
jgi:hypothetical protein